MWVSGGYIPTRLKALQKKRALSRDNKPFCHELKHVLLRLESTAEDQTIAPPPMGASTAAGDLDLDEDWDSDCGDYLDDPRYSNDAALGIGGPQSAARARSEALLRSRAFCRRDRIVPAQSPNLAVIRRQASNGRNGVDTDPARAAATGIVGNEDGMAGMGGADI